jgi:hypothetical protein
MRVERMTETTPREALEALLASSPLANVFTGQPLVQAADVQRLWEAEQARWRAALMQSVANGCEAIDDPTERARVAAAYTDEIEATLAQFSDFFARRSNGGVA